MPPKDPADIFVVVLIGLFLTFIVYIIGYNRAREKRDNDKKGET